MVLSLKKEKKNKRTDKPTLKNLTVETEIIYGTFHVLVFKEHQRLKRCMLYKEKLAGFFPFLDKHLKSFHVYN